MKQRNHLITIVFSLMLCSYLFAEDVTITTPDSEIAEGLDLQAVAEIFKESENLEAFEKALNDPETGVNNLDLDEDGYVDFIRVLEEVEDGSHYIVLQAVLGEDEYQDVATIAVEKTGDDAYNMQVQGNETLYGAHYYVAPSTVHIHTWPIIGWMYRPLYRPYRSVYYWGYTPNWWHRHHYVAHKHYHARVVRYHHSRTFKTIHTPRVMHHQKTVYKPRTSTHVKKTTVVRKPGGKTVRTNTTVHKSKSGVKVNKTKTVTKRTPSGKKTTTKKTTVKRNR